MATTRTRRHPRSREVVQKPSGAFHRRVQEVGPEHFGIVSVDCAKARSKWMLCDFFGNVLVAPGEVEHQRPALNQAIAQLHRDHDTPVPALLRDLETAIAQLPRAEYAAEAQPLHAELARIQSGRRRGPQLLGDILPIVLARLGVAGVQSPESGESDPR